MNLVRLDACNSLHQFQRDVDRILGNRYGAADSTEEPANRWTPAVDIEEQPDCFVIRADLPGVDPAQIEITTEKGVLSISGTREPAESVSAVESRRVERARGAFVRRFALPDSADADAIRAASSHGVLELVIPKRAEIQPRRIEVEAA